jgi:DNA modification methylase
MKRSIAACTVPGDVVWEPFGGLASATVAALELGRHGYAAEVDEGFSSIAEERLQEAQAAANGETVLFPIAEI